MSIFGGGGGGSSPAPTQPATTTQYIREAPGIEERKLGLMDIASSLAKTPINLPAIQVSPASALEQQGITDNKELLPLELQELERQRPPQE
jgi:hypothetical protein